MPRLKNSEKHKKCEETTCLKSHQIQLIAGLHQFSSVYILIGIKNQSLAGRIPTTNLEASNLTLAETFLVLITRKFSVLAQISEVKFLPYQCNKTNFMKFNLLLNVKFFHNQSTRHPSSKKKLKCFRQLRGSVWIQLFKTQ